MYIVFFCRCRIGASGLARSYSRIAGIVVGLNEPNDKYGDCSCLSLYLLTTHCFSWRSRGFCICDTPTPTPPPRTTGNKHNTSPKTQNNSYLSWVYFISFPRRSQRSNSADVRLHPRRLISTCLLAPHEPVDVGPFSNLNRLPGSRSPTLGRKPIGGFVGLYSASSVGAISAASHSPPSSTDDI